jgi:hypothetical protein
MRLGREKSFEVKCPLPLGKLRVTYHLNRRGLDCHPGSAAALSKPDRSAQGVHSSSGPRGFGYRAIAEPPSSFGSEDAAAELSLYTTDARPETRTRI